jgi:hypothetical protein
MSLPYFVKVGRDPHGGLIHLSAVDNRWHAANGGGSLGLFDTEEQALAAVMAAPPARKQKRLPKAEPSEAMTKVMKGWRGLTDCKSGFVVRDEKGDAIGAVMPAGERFRAWFKGDPIGEFDTPGQGANAVYAAHNRAKKRRKRRDVEKHNSANA